jgi:hypothetical protein
MAEDEIVKHSKAVIKAWKNPYTSWQKKTLEIASEILIIAFAISISVWFHNWSDSLHDRKEEREFLEGLRGDLVGDTSGLNDGTHTYQHSLRDFKYFLRVGAGESLNSDSAIGRNGGFFNSYIFGPNTSRYEALKASGKFGIIRNKELLRNIIYLHEALFPRISDLDKYYLQFQQQLSTQLMDNVTPDSSLLRFGNEEHLLRLPKTRIQMELGRVLISYNILPMYDSSINKCEQVMHQIDKELK